jgi:YfiH family protein
VVGENLDGHVCLLKGVLLAVLVADCVPVYLLDPASKAIALLHAGWRGTAGEILAAGVEKLESLGVICRENLVMHCGVSICGSCYEVGSEVVQAVTGRSDDRPETLDLRSILAGQAERLGLKKVTISPLCTVHDNGWFHSYRACGEKAGRMAAYLGVPLS